MRSERILIFALSCAVHAGLASCAVQGAKDSTEVSELCTEALERELNQLTSDINLMCGFRQHIPRYELGPSGEFVLEFHEAWNARFDGDVSVAYVEFLDKQVCPHFVIKLPDETYFDAGRGIVTEEDLRHRYAIGSTLYGVATARLRTMAPFDERFVRTRMAKPPYSDCEGFSYQQARLLIDRHLDALQAELGNR